MEINVTGVYEGNEPHGQARNDEDMVRVLLVQVNLSRKAAVKAIHVEVNYGVLCRLDSVSWHINIHTAVSKLTEVN